MKRYLALILMLLLTVLSVCSCLGPPKKEKVERLVSEQVPESAHCISIENVGNDVCYKFRSDLRDLTFDVFEMKNEGLFEGYWPRLYYSKGVREYYEDDIYKEVKACRYYKYRNETYESGNFEFRCTSDEELRETAKVIANCNRIVADQFNYTPDADLTSSKIMYFRMMVFHETINGDHTRAYILNGKDDEETIYRLIGGAADNK